MRRDDLVYVRHMEDLARSIVDKILDKTRADFDEDENLRSAVVHLIQTIGEAATRVSDAFREAHPEVPWRHVTCMRQKIVHDYMDIDFDIVWDVATTDLPKLPARLTDVAGDPRGRALPASRCERHPPM